MKVVIDIETSGLDLWRCEVIALSIGLYSDAGDLVNELDLNFKPVRLGYWSNESEAIHGISRMAALKFPDANESWGKFFDFLDQNLDERADFVCHALWLGHYFDSTFLFCQMFLSNNHWLLRKYFKSETISTHTMAQKLKSHGIYNFEKLNLAYLCQYFGISLDHHNARSDREACSKLYFKMKDRYDEVIKEESRKEAQREADQDQKDGSYRAIPSKKGRSKKRNATEMV